MKLHDLQEARYYQSPIVDWLYKNKRIRKTIDEDEVDKVISDLTKHFGEPRYKEVRDTRSWYWVVNVDPSDIIIVRSITKPSSATFWSSGHYVARY